MFGRLLNRQPSTSIGTSRRKIGTDVNYLFRFASLFRLPFHARSTSLPRSSSVPILRWLSVTATPPPVQQKSFLPMLINNAFFASLGVFIVLLHTNALRLFAHFFRRKPTGIFLKRKLYFLAFFQKNRAQV